MVGLKAVVFLAMLSIATACLPLHGKPKTGCTCHKNGPIITRPGPGLPNNGPIQSPRHDGSSWVYLGRLLLGLGGRVKESTRILNDIIHLDVAATLDDVLNVVISLGRALGLIIDILIPGLGGLFGRLVIAIARIIICIVGKVNSPGLLGLPLGGKRSPNQAICVSDYGCKWGWKRYDDKWDSDRNVIRHYDLEHARAELELIFKNYSKVHSEPGLKIISKLLYDHVLILVDLTVKNSWCKDDLITVYVSVTTITSLVANSFNSDLGFHIVDELEAFCYTHFKKSGYKDIKIYNSEIKKKLERVKSCPMMSSGGVTDSEEAKKSSVSKTSNYDDEKSRKSIKTGEEERSNDSRSKSTKSSQTNDSNSNNSQTSIDSQSRKYSEEDQSAQSRNTKAQSTNSNQSSDSTSDISRTRTDANSSNDSQKSRDDSSSVDTGKRGRKITEEVSGSSKENNESSSKESNNASNLEFDQKKIDLKNGINTDTRVVQSNSESVKEQKSASSLEKELSAKKTIEDKC